MIEGFTAIVARDALGDETEALVELFYAPGTRLEDVAGSLRTYSEVVEALSVTGEADAIARVRTRDNADLERLIMSLQRDGAWCGRARRWSCRAWWRPESPASARGLDEPAGRDRPAQSAGRGGACEPA